MLGLVSLLTDVSSEMIAPLRALFLVLVLGTPLPVAGLVEGLAETASSLLKLVSGRLADRVPRRKPLLVAGYGLSNLAKPLLALAGAWPDVLAVVLADRAGKGLRVSPRDALLADATPNAFRGKAFGFHRALDTAGAALGPLLALLIVSQRPEEDQQSLEAVRQVFAWTLVPGALAVLVLLLLLREAPRAHAPAAAADRPAVAPLAASLASLGGHFWLFTGLATLFALGNSSDAFLFLRTISLESWLEGVPLAYFGYNLVYALLATPLGALSDRVGRLPMLLAGYLAFALVYAGWALANAGWHTWLLFAVYGVYSAATDGVARALVVDLVPRARRGTALGAFSGLTGLAALPANLLAGVAWSLYGPGSTFALGAALAGLAALGLALASGRLASASASDTPRVW